MLACLSSRLHRMGDQGFTVIPSSLPTDNCTEQRPARQRYFLRGVMADAPSLVPPGVDHDSGANVDRVSGHLSCEFHAAVPDRGWRERFRAGVLPAGRQSAGSPRPRAVDGPRQAGLRSGSRSDQRSASTACGQAFPPAVGARRAKACPGPRSRATAVHPRGPPPREEPADAKKPPQRRPHDARHGRGHLGADRGHDRGRDRGARSVRSHRHAAVYLAERQDRRRRLHRRHRVQPRSAEPALRAHRHRRGLPLEPVDQHLDPAAGLGRPEQLGLERRRQRRA